MNRKEITLNAVRRFQHLPIKTIARYLIAEYGEYYDNDLEKARSAVRNVVGKNGETNRKTSATKEFFRDKPIPLPKTWAMKRTPYHLPPGLWLVMSDLHVPYHEPLPIETVIKWGQSQKVDGILLNGDVLDLAAVAFWINEKRDFNKELEAGIDFLDFLRNEFPKQKIVYKPGNHEYRLPRKITSQIPELSESPIACVETVMGFEERDIEFLDYYQKVYAGKLPIFHGHEFRFIHRSVSPARGLFLRTANFAACSHCHNTSEFTKRDCNDNIITTWSFGCLCNLSPDYNPYGNDWNWGAAMIDVEKNGSFEVENRKVMSSGKLK